MVFAIEKNPSYAQSSVTVIGLSNLYGRNQFVLVNSDEGKNHGLKFPGLSFNVFNGKSLEESARDRFEKQTGLTLEHMLGMRFVSSTRSRHNNHWAFRNVFVGVVNTDKISEPDSSDRKVYLADPNQSFFGETFKAVEMGKSDKIINATWISPDNAFIANSGSNIVSHLDLKNMDTSWYNKIPCFGVNRPDFNSSAKEGCGIAVASMMLLYQPSPKERTSVILLKRKDDKYPGYAGGKVETPNSLLSTNLDPVGCCTQEGAEEFGFSIQPRALIGCALTPLDVPEGRTDLFYNSIVNYAFVAEPTNPDQVKDALTNPHKYIKDPKIESYVVEGLDAHRDRLLRGEMRMPDMLLIGKEFYKTSPAGKINLMQLRFSGL